MADLNPQQFAQAVLQGLGIHPTTANVKALVGWQKAEGGHWNNKARYNPLNTTQPEPGAGNTGSQGNIKVYKSWDQGVKATVTTLKNGLYGGIIQALKSGNPNSVASAIGSSPWGTGGSLVAQTIGATSVKQLSPVTGAPVRPAAAQPGPGAPVAVAPASGANRQAVLQNYLSTRGRPGAVLGLAQGLNSLQTATGTAAPAGASAGAPAGGTGGAQAALGWAQSKVGFKESGTNSGGIAGYANKQFGMSQAPWCAMFTSLAVTKGGAPPEARSASVAQLLQKAQAGQGYRKGFVDPHAAQAGDLIAFGTHHVGMVDSVNRDGSITMVAGNDSDGVQKRTVRVGAGDKIIRPKYAP
jgi:hypothetical protein